VVLQRLKLDLEYSDSCTEDLSASSEWMDFLTS
jgi:hypothetical protein